MGALVGVEILGIALWMILCAAGLLWCLYRLLIVGSRFGLLLFTGALAFMFGGGWLGAMMAFHVLGE